MRQGIPAGARGLRGEGGGLFSLMGRWGCPGALNYKLLHGRAPISVLMTLIVPPAHVNVCRISYEPWQPPVIRSCSRNMFRRFLHYCIVAPHRYCGNERTKHACKKALNSISDKQFTMG